MNLPWHPMHSMSDQRVLDHSQVLRVHLSKMHFTLLSLPSSFRLSRSTTELLNFWPGATTMVLR